MNLLDKSDKEILEIANPLWDNLLNSSNNKDYGSFKKDFMTTKYQTVGNLRVSEKLLNFINNELGNKALSKTTWFMIHGTFGE